MIEDMDEDEYNLDEDEQKKHDERRFTVNKSEAA